MRRVKAQQAAIHVDRQRTLRTPGAQNRQATHDCTKRQQATKVKTQVRKGARGEAATCFLPGIARLAAEDRRELTQSLIPHSLLPNTQPTDKDTTAAMANMPAGYTVKDVRTNFARHSFRWNATPADETSPNTKTPCTWVIGNPGRARGGLLQAENTQDWC